MLTISNLRCEFLVNPLGIDSTQPRLSWVLHHPERGQLQTAYQILAASSPEKLAAGAADVWDSGKVSTARTQVEYGGRPLASRERCYWTVRTWDRHDRPGPFSEPAWFEMGLLDETDWGAEWIGFPPGLSGGALYIRKTFEVSQPVRRARVYLCGLGLHELRLNGQKVGDSVLNPAHTDYSKRVLYVTYDVTGNLRSGINAVGVILGNGWYGSVKMLFQMEIEYEDGAMIRVHSGDTLSGGAWLVGKGPIQESSIFGGEVYDARLERPGWDLPEGEQEPRTERTEKWVSSLVVDGPGGKLAPQAMEPIRVVQTVTPIEVRMPKPGIYVFDLGQNLAGWVRLYVQGAPGTAVKMRFAETLYEDGTVNQENLRGAAARDVYILKGGQMECWEPRFTYHGFRYIQVEGYPGEPGVDALEGRVVRSAVEPAGDFACSSDLLNQIYKMVWWTENSNLHGIPTDCPQRDERMGWLNDMGARTEEALFNFGMASFMAKWIADIDDAQDPISGAITDTAPYHWGNRPADPVSVCYLMIPWMLYQYYGDQRTMAAHFNGMRKWVDYLTSQAKDHIVHYSYWGDWAPPISESVQGRIGASPFSRNTPGELVSTGFYYYSTRLLAQIAGVLGKPEVEKTYRSLAREIFDAYNQRFWDELQGGYGKNNQAANALSLYFKLVPEDRQERVIDSLVKDVVDLHDNHLTTGNLCTKYLLEVLTENGRADISCRIAMQETYPSWGYMLANGATTLWERWENMTGGGMNSHNHPMLGSVGSWFFKTLAGITVDPSGPGFERFSVKPNIVCGLKHASASIRSVRGLVETGWERVPDGLALRVEVPAGCRVWVNLPKPEDGSGFRIREGERIIWEKGQPAGMVEGAAAPAYENDRSVIFDIGSGSYRFRREDLAEGSSFG